MPPRSFAVNLQTCLWTTPGFNQHGVHDDWISNLYMNFYFKCGTDQFKHIAPFGVILTDINNNCVIPWYPETVLFFWDGYYTMKMSYGRQDVHFSDNFIMAYFG